MAAKNRKGQLKSASAVPHHEDASTIHPAADSVARFCQSHGISKATFYNLIREGHGPATMKVGRRTLISRESAEVWRRRMEAATAGTRA